MFKSAFAQCSQVVQNVIIYMINWTYSHVDVEHLVTHIPSFGVWLL
jgi:hypothetical protein